MSNVKVIKDNNNAKKQKKAKQPRKPLSKSVKITICSVLGAAVVVALVIGFYRDYAKLEKAEAYTISANDAASIFSGIRTDGTDNNTTDNAAATTTDNTAATTTTTTTTDNAAANTAATTTTTDNAAANNTAK